MGNTWGKGRGVEHPERRDLGLQAVLQPVSGRREDEADPPGQEIAQAAAGGAEPGGG